MGTVKHLKEKIGEKGKENKNRGKKGTKLQKAEAGAKPFLPCAVLLILIPSLSLWGGNLRKERDSDSETN